MYKTLTKKVKSRNGGNNRTNNNIKIKSAFEST